MTNRQVTEKAGFMKRSIKLKYLARLTKQKTEKKHKLLISELEKEPPLSDIKKTINKYYE